MTRPDRPRALRAASLLGAAGALLLAGCNLPAAGPSTEDIAQQQAAERRFPFRLVTVTPEMVSIIADGAAPAEEAFVTDLGPQEPAIGPGDAIAVTIAEAAGGGLFSPPPAPPTGLPAPLPAYGVPLAAPATTQPAARVLSFPPATVGEDGRIRVPFAGSIAAAGRTPAQIAASIDDALRGQSLDAHATVRIAGRAGRIGVAGEVRSPGVQEVPQGGQTVLGLIARAGGPTVPVQDAVVQLNRYGTVHSVRLAAVMADPTLNVHLRAGDTLTLVAAPRRYTVLGAAARQQTADLPQGALSVAEALAGAHGLRDDEADPHGVYLLRDEAPAVVARLDAVAAKYARARGEVAPIPPERPLADHKLPVAYRIDLGTANGLFVARRMAVREGDLIYVAEAGAAGDAKLLRLLAPPGKAGGSVQAAQ